MKKFFLGLIFGIIIGATAFYFLAKVIEDAKNEVKIEGTYFAHPPQLNTSLDFRNDGTMFMASGGSGEWFRWRLDDGKIHAQSTSAKYKGKEIVFEIKGKELFLGKIRFKKSNN